MQVGAFVATTGSFNDRSTLECLFCPCYVFLHTVHYEFALAQMFTVISVFLLCHPEDELTSMPDAEKLEIHPIS